MTAKGVLLALLVAMMGSGSAYAVRAAYEGPLGNPEEPALRPYKWLWHGVKALAFQPVASLHEGNIKAPCIGSVDMFIGVRRGTVEMGESVFRGICGGEVPRSMQYKELGTVNQIIEADPLLRNTSNFVAAGPVPVASVGVFAVQKTTDANCDETQVEKKHEQMHRDWEQRKADERAKAAMDEPEKMERARKAYLGDRYHVNKRDMYKGDLRKLVR